MEIKIPKEILEFADSKGYEVVDVRCRKNGEEYISGDTTMVISSPYDFDKGQLRYIVKKKRWKPKQGDRYEYVYANSVVSARTWNNDVHDEAAFSAGNYFKEGSGQAQKAAKALPEFFAQFREDES